MATPSPRGHASSRSTAPPNNRADRLAESYGRQLSGRPSSFEPANTAGALVAEAVDRLLRLFVCAPGSEIVGRSWAKALVGRGPGVIVPVVVDRERRSAPGQDRRARVLASDRR